MRGSFLLPGWAREHIALAVGIIVLFAIILRSEPREAAMTDPVRSDRYLPVAAAIGLAPAVPGDAALATWIHSGLYGARYALSTLTSSDASLVDFCAGFIRDPDSFCALASFASLAASAFAILLAYCLLARLVDPVAGIGAAFLLAVHPLAVDFTAGINSGSFCLLFLLCGLSVSARINWAQARPVELAAVGLSLGFALDAIPFAAAIFLSVVILGLRATPARLRRERFWQCALAAAFFAAAGSLVISSAIPPAETLQVLALSVSIAAALLLAAHALRSCRKIAGDSAYSAAVLSLVLVVSIIAISGPPAATTSTDAPGMLAADWLTQNAPSGSVIAVDPALAAAVPLPRSAQSWLREYQVSGNVPDSSRFYALAAARAAAQISGPRFDVLSTTSAAPGGAQPAVAQAPPDMHYLVLPEKADPAPLGCDGAWLVARFRSSDDTAPGVVIWGTAASPEAQPVHVEWQLSDGVTLAADSPAG